MEHQMFTPWDNPEAFKKLTLKEVLDSGVNCDECNLWDGNVAFTNKPISPLRQLPNGNIVCLYSGVVNRVYKPDHEVYLLESQRA